MLHKQEETALLSGSFLSRGSIHICPCNKGTAVFVFMVMTKWTTRSALYQALILAHCSLMGSVFSIPCGLAVQQGAPQLNACAGGKMMDAFTAKLYINSVCVYLRDSHWTSWRMKKQTFGCCSSVLMNQLRQNSTLWYLLMLDAELRSPGWRFWPEQSGWGRLGGRGADWEQAGRESGSEAAAGPTEDDVGGRFSAALSMWTQRKWGLPPAQEISAPQIKSQESCWALAAP